MSFASPTKPARKLAAIRFTGTDRRQFLQGQVTNDMELLAPDRPLLAGWNTAKGRLSCLCWLVEWQDATWMLLPAELSEDVARRLRMFVLRANVTVETDSGTEVAGVAEAPDWVNNSSDKDQISKCFYSEKYFFLATGGGGGLLLGTDLPPPAETTWRLANIRAGIPVVWAETKDEFVPQMVNLDLLEGISFTKGCYVGQEIVARTQNLGRIKRRMYGFEVDGGHEVLPGTQIIAGQKNVGQVVDAVADGDTTALLGVVRIEALDQQLTLAGHEYVSLRRVDLPYRIPEST
jgi:folate-binding protein YgfZ